MTTTPSTNGARRPVTPAAATRAAPDWDLVRKRNNVEKLKFEKHPVRLIDELVQLGEMDYLEITEEDMVRFQWYGLYHDKPKVGYMMMRIRVPGGILQPDQLRVIGFVALFAELFLPNETTSFQRLFAFCVARDFRPNKIGKETGSENQNQEACLLLPDFGLAFCAGPGILQLRNFRHGPGCS